MYSVVTLVIVALATMRLSSLLIAEEGPFDILGKFRYRIGVRYDAKSEAYGTNEFAKLFTCIWCLSVWMGLLMAIAFYFIPVILFWVCLPFAISAAAIVVEKHT